MNAFGGQFALRTSKAKQKSKYNRLNKTGLTWPWHKFQIISYIFYILNIVLFYTVVIPSFDSEIKITFGVIYFLLVALTCIMSILATVTNPTDPTVLKEIHLQLNNQSLIPENDHNFCYFCEAHCSFHSKHCSQCNRCIYKFDHHCVWLNNCIGERNYKWFFLAIILLSLQMGVQSLINILSLITYSMNKENYLIQPSEIMLALQCILLIFGIICGSLTSQLSIFHIWLCYNNLSTFELIKLHREFDEEDAKNDAEQGKKTGGTTQQQIGSAFTPNVEELAHNNHKSSINKNIISDEHPRDQIERSSHKNLKRKGLNMSSDHFMNINSLKSNGSKDQIIQNKSKPVPKLTKCDKFMKENFICCCFCFIQKGFLKKRNYNAIKQDEKSQKKEHFEPKRPQDFSDLVANNIKENSDNPDSNENSGLFHLHGLSNLRNFENIEEANEESSSTPSNKSNKRQAHTSLMEKFRDPKSSASSEDFKSEVVQIPKIIRDPNDKIIQQVIDTKFLSNTDGMSHINHDSELIDQNFNNSHAIIRREAEIRVIRSDVSGDTSNRHLNNSTFSPKPPLIGKSTRSRNLQNTIKASLGSNDSRKMNINKNFGEMKSTVDKTINQTMIKRKSKGKLNTIEQSTMEKGPEHEELSDFETFRNLDSSDVGSAFKTGGLNKRLSKPHHNCQEESKFQEESKIDQIPKAKIMGFFETNQSMSRNNGLKNVRSDSVKLESKAESSFAHTIIQPILENEGEASYSPEFEYVKTQKNKSESTEPNILQFTDTQQSKQVRTAGEESLNISDARRITTKVKKKHKLRENFLKSTERRDDSLSPKSRDLYQTPFQLNEMDFRQDASKKKETEDGDKISDVAKTFRNLRNQLMNQNRSRAKLDLNKIKSQKTESDAKLQNPLAKSRNVANTKINSQELRSSIKTTKVFTKKNRKRSLPEDDEVNSATTLYVEAVSNNMARTNGTEEEEKRPKNSKFQNLSQRSEAVSNDSLTLDKDSSRSALTRPKRKTNKKSRKLKKAKKRVEKAPRPDYIFCENDEVLNQEEDFSLLTDSKVQDPKNMYSYFRHNLSKVEEEEADETLFEIHN
ncbi:unnamed protein product [Moneuplotes crassus]|uniref:Palmitoyltransferase DHHC domain-containing protein n=2 Tax=Euplotes crassus TaxID=5936 RepID=A0AAD2D013_EUPCR|nr:unnamed protein product [Moneuplotes crassus]